MPLVDDEIYFEILDERPRWHRHRRKGLRDQNVPDVFFYPDDTVFEMGWEGLTARLPPGRRRPSRPRTSTADSRIFPELEDADTLMAWERTQPVRHVRRLPVLHRPEQSDHIKFFADTEEASVFQTAERDMRRLRHLPRRLPVDEPLLDPEGTSALLSAFMDWQAMDIAAPMRIHHRLRAEVDHSTYPSGELVNPGFELVWSSFDVAQPRHRFRTRSRPVEESPLPSYPGLDMADEHPLSWTMAQPRARARMGRQRLDAGSPTPQGPGTVSDVQPSDSVVWMDFNIGRLIHRPPIRRDIDRLAFFADDDRAIAIRMDWLGDTPHRTNRRATHRIDEPGDRPHEQASLDSDQVAEIIVAAVREQPGRIRRLPRSPREAAETGIVSITELIFNEYRVFDDQPRPRRVQMRSRAAQVEQQVSYNGSLTVTGPYVVIAGSIFVAGAVAGEVTTS